MVWLTPTIMSARGGSHCSTKSRRLTLPAQQPRSQASWSSAAAAGGGGAAGSAAGTALAACAWVPKKLATSMAQATTTEPSWVDRFIGIRSSLRPRKRQVQKQILRLELESMLAIDGHRQIDAPTRERRAHCRRVGKAKLEQAQQPLQTLVADLGAIVQVIEQRARLRVEADVPYPAPVVNLPPRTDRHL